MEVNKNLAMSCALPILDGMVVYTDSFRVRMAREGVLEFLLVIIL